MNSRTLALGVLLCLLGGSSPAAATQPAAFAIVIGVNRSVDPELAPLRYADDDAARYLDLFRAIGARTVLVSRLDDNTRRLHPQAAAEALDPTAAGLELAVARITEDVRRAHAAGIPTVLYVAYAGHGNARDGEGYLMLEDTRLTGRMIAQQVLGRIDATESHLIVDACYSNFLVFGRGPTADVRKPVRGFALFEDVLPADRTGLLLSTSSARESHEWDAYQSGVFSHEVRSGLYGAADLDGDGRVSYREIAAFIQRANESIPNERFRPDVYARPPRSGAVLVDLREGTTKRLRLDGKLHGHFMLEDARGVRIADFHNAPGYPLDVLRPGGLGPLFLRRADDVTEWKIGSELEVAELSLLSSSEIQVAMRGATHESFGTLFSLAFEPAQVEAYTFRRLEAPRVWMGWSLPRLHRAAAGGAMFGLSAISLATTIGLSIAAHAEREGTSPFESNASVIERNRRINRYNAGAWALGGIAAGTAVIGSVLFVWPDSSHKKRP